MTPLTGVYEHTGWEHYVGAVSLRKLFFGSGAKTHGSEKCLWRQWENKWRHDWLHELLWET